MKKIALPGGAAMRLAVLAGTTSAVLALTASSAAALTAHGQLLRVGPRLRANTNTSSNWFGYNQGTLEQGGKLFNSISGQWTVPTATQHTAGQAEASSDWIGIGGGCIDAGCTTTDSTLIQTGTEQDVSATGAASYDAWYELVPAPELQITSLTVHPGDRMSASIAEVVSDSNAWTITIKDLTTGQSYSTTVPYSSSHATAEWIEETPLEIGTNAGFAALPNLSQPAFGSATTNGQPAGLKASEELDLIDSNGNVIGAPSAPNATANGFDECTWASTCS
jgi:Peptidase A4 family